MRVIGIDPSLSCTGVAVASGRGVDVFTVTSRPATGDLPVERLQRIRVIVRTVMDHAIGVDGAVIEGPAYASTTGRQHDRSGLWWMLVHALSGVCPVVEVPPKTRARYATGRGNASKDEVLAAVIRRYPDVAVTNNNAADAVVLAAMGARWWGHPVEASLPAMHASAMDKVAWPVPVTEVPA